MEAQDIDGTDKNLASFFQNRAYANRHRGPWLTLATEKVSRSYTWDEAEKAVRNIGRGLISMGVKTEDRVAIYSENCPEWILTDLATLSIGAVTVPIYATSTVDQAICILAHCEAKFVFVSNANQAKEIFARKKEMPDLKEVVLLPFDPSQETKNGIMKFDEVIGQARKIPAQLFFQRLSKIRAQDLATFIYTSGTTGEPRGVMLTHENLLSNSKAALTRLPLRPEDVHLSLLPLSHAFERTAGFFSILHAGAQIFFSEGIQKAAVALKKIKPTFLLCVPRVLEKFHERIEMSIQQKPKWIQFFLRKSTRAKQIRKHLGGRVRFIVCGGAALKPKTASFFQSLGLDILEGYGLTEASPIISVNPILKSRSGTVGPALPGVEIKVSPEGELLVKGANVMKGYFKDKAATAESIDDEGFLHTGDIAEVGSDGYITITDRKKELIVTSGGKNIAPTPIESELESDPFIAQACVLGEGEKYLIALIVPAFDFLEAKANGAKLPFENRESLLAHEKVQGWYEKIVKEVNHRQPSYQRIVRFRLLQEEFTIDNGEMTPTLKIRRGKVQERYRALISGLYGD